MSTNNTNTKTTKNVTPTPAQYKVLGLACYPRKEVERILSYTDKELSEMNYGNRCVAELAFKILRDAGL